MSDAGAVIKCYPGAMTAVPEWMHPPRVEGWYADDLNDFPVLPNHTELIDGALVFVLSPQRAWHDRVATVLGAALTELAPAGVSVKRETMIRLDERNRMEPDLLAAKAFSEDSNRTVFTPDEVLLVVEVVALESAHRDRTVKFRKYAEASIPNHWRVEDENGAPVIHAYALDGSARAYHPTGIHRHKIQTTAPFAITLDLTELVREQRS